MQNTFLFNLVSGTVYTVPIFFFCSGFLQAYSLIQADNKGSMFQPKSLVQWYARKIFRFVPLNVMAMVTIIFLLPLLGNGPIWNKFR